MKCGSTLSMHHSSLRWDKCMLFFLFHIEDKLLNQYTDHVIYLQISVYTLPFVSLRDLGLMVIEFLLTLDFIK